eukprot:Nk52_evm13s1737 gene=Nk52_evmTU13s1737
MRTSSLLYRALTGPGAKSNQRLFQPVFRDCASFPVDSENVRIMHTPGEFYEALLAGIERAQHRIVLSSLYLGTGGMEEKLIEVILAKTNKEKLQDGGGGTSAGLRVTFLVDYLRGTRVEGGGKSSRDMLVPVVKGGRGTEEEEARDGGDVIERRRSVGAYFYHTPALTGLWKKVLPPRFNEGVGLQHMKLYIFDDEIIFSGANLSEMYFRQRQDRYMGIRNEPELCDFGEQLVELIGRHSYELNPNGSLTAPSSSSSCSASGSWVDPVVDPAGHKQAFQRDIVEFLHGYGVREEKVLRKAISGGSLRRTLGRKYKRMQEMEMGVEELEGEGKELEEDGRACGSVESVVAGKKDTVVYPLVQMGVYGVRQDEYVTSLLLLWKPLPLYLRMASGYFNFTDNYEKFIVEMSKHRVDILTSSPQANGFFTARGIAGYIPDAYTYILQKFYNKVMRAGALQRVRVFEYYRDKWTYHAKGLWIYRQDEEKPLPAVTLIGSPNFGYRSLHRDVEAQFAVVTDSRELSERLHEEAEGLFGGEGVVQVSKKTFGKEGNRRELTIPVKVATTAIRTFF